MEDIKLHTDEPEEGLLDIVGQLAFQLGEKFGKNIESKLLLDAGFHPTQLTNG